MPFIKVVPDSGNDGPPATSGCTLFAWGCGHLSAIDKMTFRCCIRKRMCCVMADKPLFIGISSSPLRRCLLVKCGTGFCVCSNVQPHVFCAYGIQSCCIRKASSVPLHPDYVGEAAFALYGVPCSPSAGFLVSPPPCPVLEQMDRDFSRYQCSTPYRHRIDVAIVNEAT